MITITKDLKIPDSPSRIVCSPEGDYADTDLILCAEKTKPDLALAQLEAQYIKYGPVIYQFNTPEELGAAIFALDPESTLDAVALYKEQLARDAARAAGTLTPADPVPTPDSPTQDQTAPIEEEEEPQDEEEEEEDENETPSIDEGDVLGEATTTDDGTPPEESPPGWDPATPASEASTTPPDSGEASSTPPVEEPVPIPTPATDLSTTTPE